MAGVVQHVVPEGDDSEATAGERSVESTQTSKKTL